jgi:hypothetical protein
MQTHNPLSGSAALAQAVSTARTPENIKRLLSDAAAELGEHHWRDLGDRPNNAGTVQIASSPASALIERATNAIDGMLELKAEEHAGDLPASPVTPPVTGSPFPGKGSGNCPRRSGARSRRTSA